MTKPHVVVSMLLLLTACCGVDAAGSKIPILYSTDLFQPHDDPDDHFDLATLFAIQEFDIRGIVLDLGRRQQEKPGRVPIEQMCRLTGRRVPYAVGLAESLKSPDDRAFGQPANCQRGVRLILDTLKSSRKKVTIFTTGSVRDVAAAFNRDPNLLRRKVDRLYINIGTSEPRKYEWNVKLDKTAYVCVLRSGLPIYWCPCMGTPFGTYWKFRQSDVLETAPAPLQNFFILALSTGSWWKNAFKEAPPAGTDDPMAFLFQRVEDRVRQRIWQAPRNMWCTGPFFHAAGRQIVELEPGRWAALPRGKASGPPVTPYDFVPGQLTVNNDAFTRFEEVPDGQPLNAHAFKLLDQERYPRIMTSCLRELFRQMHVSFDRPSSDQSEE